MTSTILSTEEIKMSMSPVLSGPVTSLTLLLTIFLP